LQAQVTCRHDSSYSTVLLVAHKHVAMLHDSRDRVKKCPVAVNNLCIFTTVLDLLTLSTDCIP